MSSEFINPHNQSPLRLEGDRLIDQRGNSFPIVAGVPRICELDNYTSTSGGSGTI